MTHSLPFRVSAERRKWSPNATSAPFRPLRARNGRAAACIAERDPSWSRFRRRWEAEDASVLAWQTTPLSPGSARGGPHTTTKGSRMRLLIMGPPGAGKGTQATGIAQRYSIPAISSGDIFRDNIKRHTPLGERVVEIIARGDFVPDVLTTSLVFQRITEPDCWRGWLLDGYPRTAGQVEALDIVLAETGTRLDAVIVLTVDQAALVSRMLKRAEIEGRADDNAESISHRIDVYHAQTAEVIAIYRERGLVVDVDAMGLVDEVRDRIASGIDGLIAARG